MPDLRPIVFLLGVLITVASAVTMIPAAYAYYSIPLDIENARAFLVTSGVAILSGLPMMLFARGANFRLAPRQMYLLTVSSWILISLVGALPFMLSTMHMSVVNAIFESVSGLTTTGSTVMTGLADVPKSILLWRACQQWAGGIGIVVMVVAIMPHLRVGGMRLFRSEASDKSEKFTARSSKVAQAIGAVYLLLSVLCAAFYWMAGMDSFNAIVHAMTTVSTGGFSTSDLSMQQFASGTILWIATIFMFLAGLPFVLLSQMLQGNVTALKNDQQVRGYAVLVICSVVMMFTWLVYSYEMPLSQAVRIAAFNTVAILTTTGYTIIDYNVWGGFAVGALFFMTFVGACAGSTAGGMKIFRFQVAALMLKNHVRTMVHPRGVYSTTFNNRHVSDDIVSSIIAFTFVFGATIAVLAVALSLTGLDLVTSLSGAATAVANVGPGLGDTIGPAGNFSTLPDIAKWILVIGMLLGRLEILTVLVLFTGVFWRG